MNNLHQVQLRRKKKVNSTFTKIVISVVLVCGVANTYIMGLLWYKRGFHWSYVGVEIIMLVIIALVLWMWPEKKYYPNEVDVDKWDNKRSNLVLSKNRSN